MKITKRVIDSLVLPQKGQVFVWEKAEGNDKGCCAGFGVRLTPNTKSYVCQRRVSGKNVRVTIGRHGAWTPDTAREKAREIIRQMDEGVNPNTAKRKEVEAAKTLQDAVDAYLIDRTLKARSKTDILRHLETNFYDWKDLPLADITRQMVMDRFREISLRSKAQANQAFRNLRAWFNYALEAFRVGDERLLSENPVSVLSGSKMWHTITPKNRRIPLNRLGDVIQLLHHIRNYPATSLAGQSQADAMLFILLTGGRRSEVTTLRWEHVDLETGFWFIESPKNKKPVKLPLSQQAIDMLAARPRVNKFVFCSQIGRTGHISTGQGLTEQITKLVGAKVSPHDLRRTFRSIAAECGVEFWRTKLLMNHSVSGDVTLSAYTEREDLEYLRPDIQRIGDYITGAYKSATKDNVIPFFGGTKHAG